MSSMRAWIHSVAGPPSEVLIFSETTKPAIKSPTDILIRISHVALHPGSSIMMQLCPFIFRAKPAIPETEFSGTVVETGSSALSFVPGTEVWGTIPVGKHIAQGVGALAEYVVVDVKDIAHKPGILSLAQASGLPVSGCTALALMENARLKQGDSVLVNGASGGVGHMVVQLAKLAVGESGKVVAICSKRNAEMVKQLGADEVIDYNNHAPVHRYLAETYSDPRFDCVIDAFGIQELYTNCADYLAKGKPFVSVGIAFKAYKISSVLYTVYLMLKNTFWPGFLGGVKRPHLQVAVVVKPEGMQNLAKLVEAGDLSVFVENPIHWEAVLDAYDIALSKRARGKVVVEVHSVS